MLMPLDYLESLKKNITFANHNLISDAVFAETNLVICRNVLIYFQPKLQIVADSMFQSGQKATSRFYKEIEKKRSK